MYYKKNYALYSTIAQKISSDIEKGLYQPGDFLKKQSEYAKEYRTSCGTIKKAFALLKERGLITTIKGHGTVVRGFHNTINPHSGSFRTDVEHASETCDTRVLFQGTIYAKPLLAVQLGIETLSPCYQVQLIRTMKGQPVCYQNIYIRFDKVCEIDLPSYDLSRHSLFSLYTKLTDSSYLFTDKDLYAVLCPPEVCPHLLLKETDPVLFIKSVLHYGEEIIEYNETYERTDLRPHCYRKEFSIP